MGFKYQGANIPKPTVVPGYEEYLPNCWEIINDLGVNSMLAVNGVEGGNEWNITSNPNWAENVEAFLADADAHGVKVVFQHLGKAAYPTQVMFGIYDLMDLTLAKSMVDKIGGNNSLGKNFFTDPRVDFWIVSNEPSLSYSNQPLTDWLITMGDYLRSKGAKVAIIGGYMGPTNYEADGVQMFAGHQDIINIHHYHLGITQTAQNNGQSVYDAVYPYFKTGIDNVIAVRGDIPLSNIVFGEAGVGHPPFSEGGTTYNFTEETRQEYYRALFQACKDTNIGGVYPFLLFDVIGENWGAVALDGTYFPAVTNQYKSFYTGSIPPEPTNVQFDYSIPYVPNTNVQLTLTRQ